MALLSPNWAQELARLHERLDVLERKIDAVAQLIAQAPARAAASPANVPMIPVSNVPEGVIHLLSAGHRQQAIDAYQQLAGVDQKTAESVVASLAQATKLGS